MPPAAPRTMSAAGAVARAGARLRGAIADLFLPDDARLDERTRLAVARRLTQLVDGIEADLRRQAARLLAGRGEPDAAAALLGEEATALARLTDAGVLRDPELIDELIARTRTTLIAAALPVVLDEPERPSLLVRLAEAPDRLVAAAAHALLAVDSRPAETIDPLPAELQHRLTWWVAAAISGDEAADAALADAAQRCLAAHDEGERSDAAAMRLAVALDPLPDELPALLVDAVGDRRLALFVALLGRALGVDGDQVRALVVEPDDDRLWLALRAAGLGREQIARIGLSLAEADPRRDIDHLADRLDGLATIEVHEAIAAMRSLRLPRDLRHARRALEPR